MIKKYIIFNKLFYVALILLILLIGLIAFTFFKLITGNIIDGDTGKVLKLKDELSFVIPIGIISITWLISLIIMLRQKFKFNYAFTISDEGIHNCLLGGIFFAFIFIIPIKFIPWKNINNKGNRLVINIKELENMSLFSRLIIRLYEINLLFLYTKVDEDFMLTYKEYGGNSDVDM